VQGIGAQLMRNRVSGTTACHRRTFGVNVDWSQIGVVVLMVAAGVFTWGLNEKSKRRFEDYVRREARYVELVRSIRGFHAQSEDRDTKERFLVELELCWLYGSDDVIRAAYAFLNTVKTGVTSTDEQKSLAAGELVSAIRQDLLDRKPLKTTTLKPADFEILGAN